MTEFRIGDSGTIGAVEWRIVQGKKSASDKRLDIRCAQFAPPKMTLSFLLADFYASNEETLAREGYLARSVIGRAGERYLNFCKGAQLLGWKDAAAQLELERSRRAA